MIQNKIFLLIIIILELGTVFSVLSVYTEELSKIQKQVNDIKILNDLNAAQLNQLKYLLSLHKIQVFEQVDSQRSPKSILLSKL